MKPTRRSFLAAAALPGLRAAARRPNIIFVYTDDQAAWSVGYGGNHQARTPNTDRLCREGAYFSNSFATTPVCSPSRASLMTGRYALEVGFEDYLSPEQDAAVGLDPKLPVWPRSLRAAGYRTALIGKWHLGYKPEYHPTRFGFEYFAGFIGGGLGPMDPALEVAGERKQFRGSTPDILTGFALDFMRRHRAEPFLLCLHHREPHASNAPGVGADRTWLPIPDEDWRQFRDLDPAIPNPRYDRLDVPSVKRMMREYLASVEVADRNLGRVLGLVDELGLAGNTIVVFTADNGMNMGHNGIWHKGNGRWILTDNKGDRPNLYDNSLRVPAVIRWPGRIRPGTKIRETVTNLDWFPTLLAMANVPVPSAAVLRGHDLTPLISGAKLAWDNDLYAEYNMRHGMKADLRAWRTPEWKLVRDLRNAGRDELYNLAKDPEETQNLINSSDPAVQFALRQLRHKLEARLRQLRTPD